MVKKIIIDAAFCEETRVATIENGILTSFDHEFKDDERIKGSIYLAVVKHIEPSLQAVFVEYEHGKQGFLPFSEISPEYYCLSEDSKASLMSMIYKNYKNFCGTNDKNQEHFDALEKNLRSLCKKYKVKDVIKCGQKIIVQAVKDERGSKCASFTSYVTIIGRYVLFMPNGGMKIFCSKKGSETSMRPIPFGFEVRNSMSLYVSRNSSDDKIQSIESDLMYIIKIWESIKLKSLTSGKCLLLYTDFDIIRRTIRDSCDDSISEIIVSGSIAYKKVSDYFRFTNEKKIKLKKHKDSVPIFYKYGIEEQLAEMYSNIVRLPSGGHLVISQTEAFVSIDVNSGKMTAESNLEDTAYKTNMEAAIEIPRQVKIKGLSGLIVIDFIDMVRYRYCRDVESAVKDSFKIDNVKTHVGNISSFGLMAISRQRTRSSIFETSMVPCSVCSGTGKIRSQISVATDIIREVRFIASKNTLKEIFVYTEDLVVQELFNFHRKEISDIENESNVKILFEISPKQDKFFNIKVSGKLHIKDKSSEEMALISEHESFQYDDLLRSGNKFWIYMFFRRLWMTYEIDS